MDFYGYLSYHFDLALDVLKPIYLGSLKQPDGVIGYLYRVTTSDGNKIMELWRDYDGVNIAEL